MIGIREHAERIKQEIRSWFCENLLETAASPSSDYVVGATELGMCPGGVPAMIDRARSGCLPDDERTKT